MIRTLTPESENEKPPKNEKAQLVRAWFERLPRMRAQIQQQEERIVDLQCIATATTSSVSAAPGRSGTSDKVGNGGAAIVEAEEKLAALKCEYSQFSKNYVGIVDNTDAGRMEYKSAVVKYLTQLQASGGIQNFDGETDVTVEKGDAKDAVLITLAIEAVGSTNKIYITLDVA